MRLHSVLPVVLVVGCSQTVVSERPNESSPDAFGDFGVKLDAEQDGGRLGGNEDVFDARGDGTLAASDGGPLRDAETYVERRPPPPSDVGGLACSALRAAGTAPIIDDFQAKSARILGHEGRGGWWFDYDDGTAGEARRERVVVDGGAESGGALHVASSGFSSWGSGFGANLHPETSTSRVCSYDASTYVGVRFRARGHGRLRMLFADLASTPVSRGGTCTRAGEGCSDAPGTWVELAEPWKTYEYPFCTLLPEGWGGSTDALDPSKLVGLQFRAEAHEHVEMWLDDLAFYQADADAAPVRCGAACPLDAVPSSATIAPLVSDATLTEELSLHTFEQETTSCGPLTRRYLSYVPSQLGPRSSAPVLIMLHGSSDNAEGARSFQTRGRFDALAARDGFIVVYGNAAPGANTSTDPNRANTGVWRQSYYSDGEVDDVEYLARVLADLKARGVIEGDNAVFLTGLSNGGGMVLEAARRMPERLRGIAAMMPYDGTQPKGVPDLAGTSLRRVLLTYTLADPGLPAGYDKTLASLPAKWAVAMGIPEVVIKTPQTTPWPDVVVEGEGYQGSGAVPLATRNSRITQLDMVAPDGDGQVRVLVLDHAGHFWPNPKQDTEDWILDTWGFRNQDFDAADVVWAYLRTAEVAAQPR